MPEMSCAFVVKIDNGTEVQNYQIWAYIKSVSQNQIVDT